MITAATTPRTGPAAESAWRRTELMMTSAAHRDGGEALVIDDLDHPVAITAAFTYCG